MITIHCSRACAHLCSPPELLTAGMSKAVTVQFVFSPAWDGLTKTAVFTNGKTTVSNLLTDILEADGKKVLSNRSGSNITSGISTALLRGSDLLGRAKSYDMAVLEVDERASVRIFPYVKPDYVAVSYTHLTLPTNSRV